MQNLEPTKGYEELVEVFMTGGEHIHTFGGECNDPDLFLEHYGIDFDTVTIYDLTPNQMVMLAKSIIDHLILNGHQFEIRKTNEQDQQHELIHLK
jgi:hypothetical protein